MSRRRQMSLSVDHTTTYDCKLLHCMRALHTVNLQSLRGED